MTSDTGVLVPDILAPRIPCKDHDFKTMKPLVLATWKHGSQVSFFYLVTNFYLSHVSRGKYFIRYNTIWNYFSIYLNERKKVGQMPNKTYPQKGLYNHKIPISIGIMAP